ncbi:MAG: hypothetical protein A3B38_00435 [Candidatus Levybacteria bacterium RIFCSPLOWO2_01_FULL_36_13]|nr:MAG: hypothetical protein A2684_01675 [Candidatus Levybacteria bacterium RIFCSPHIGHO2_01_FULL_36_15b]OGH35356.1 MAG: hypothetical protein A3B38_00435 [Candidatus Levybacteria bacterium RIFCSPLOWO2_01_FULL_36_13]
MLELDHLAARAEDLGNMGTASAFRSLIGDSDLPYSITLEEYKKDLAHAEEHGFADRDRYVKLKAGIKGLDIASFKHAVPNHYKDESAKDYVLTDSTVVTVGRGDLEYLTIIVQNLGRSKQIREASAIRLGRIAYHEIQALRIGINPIEDNFGKVIIPEVRSESNRLYINNIHTGSPRNQEAAQRFAIMLLDELSALPEFQPKEKPSSQAA